MTRRILSALVVASCAMAWHTVTAREASTYAFAPVQWALLLRSAQDGASIWKISGCEGCPNAGGVSVHAITGGQGAVEFVPAAGHRLFAGLTETTAALPSPLSLPYAFSFWADGAWDVREGNVYKTEGRFDPGDVFRIEVEGGLIRYLRNGAVVHQTVAPAPPALYFGTILYSKQASLSSSTIASAMGPAPVTYTSTTDTLTRVKPTLLVPGLAGSTIIDPVFGTMLQRITDAATRPSKPGRSFRTPSGSHQHAWSAEGRYFYVVSNDGTIIPYSFDASIGQASRIAPSTTGAGGLTLQFFNEAQFSYVTDSQIYATRNGAGATLRTVDQFDFSTGLYTKLIDLDQLAPNLAGTRVAGIASSAGPVERVLAFFGGAAQDQHHYVVVFEKNNPARRQVLDSVMSTIDGEPLPSPLNFKLHHATIDRSGRFVLLYPTSVDLALPRKAAHVYVWDTATNVVEGIEAAANPNGHDAPGYGMLVNQDCCTSSKWDAAQWQWRMLSAPQAPRDLITPTLLPKHVSMADHPSWHNARPDMLTPFFTATYRYGLENPEWRAWDDEILAVDTNVEAGASATVWRVAHHRSDVAHDSDPSRIYFWYTPRPNVSPDGRWVLFTSNWEKSLGPDPVAEPGGGFRQDVFLARVR